MADDEPRGSAAQVAWREALEEYKLALANYDIAYQAFTVRARKSRAAIDTFDLDAEREAGNRLLAARRRLYEIDRERATALIGTNAPPQPK